MGTDTGIERKTRTVITLHFVSLFIISDDLPPYFYKWEEILTTTFHKKEYVV